MILSIQEDFSTYVEAECFDDALDALRSLFLQSHAQAKQLYDSQPSDVKAQIKWPPYSDALSKDIKLVQGFLKSSRPDKVNLHLENVKKADPEVWDKLVDKHQMAIQKVLGNNLNLNLQDIEEHEEVKLPPEHKKKPSITARRYQYHKVGPPKPASEVSSEDEAVYNYESPTEVGSEEDLLFEK